MPDTIAIKNGKFARLNDRPIFFFTETRTIVFDFPQGYSYSQDDEYELSLDVDTDVTTGPMLRVFGSVDTENRKVTFVLPFYGDEVKERINGRDSSVMLVIQLARVSNTTGVRHILLHDTVLCIPAVDDGGDGSEVLPDAEQQPANAHYTVQELDDLLATAPLFQFSADGEEWHDEQDEDDVFIRFSNAETREVHWSGPIRFMPADFAEYVQRARQAALDAEAGAVLAESYAKGGTGTRTGEDTDNSKYYSEQSAAQAGNAATSASTADAKATLAESYAKGGTGTRSGEDADNAKYYKEQAVTSAQSADANAVLAESYAKGGTGTRSGEDADNAKYYNTGAEDARDGANDAQTLAETAQAAAESAATNAATATGAAITAQFSEALSKVAGQVTAAQASANSASASQVSAAGDASKSNVWAEGTDAQVQALGGEHSAKRWAEIGGGGGEWGMITGTLSNQTDLQGALDAKADLVNGRVPSSELPDMGASWGSITGDLSEQTDLADALDGKANLVDGKVPSAELPVATSTLGAVKIAAAYGITANQGELHVNAATDSLIDDRTNVYRPIVPATINYAVRSVLPNVTTIPAATTSYSLLDASATTNNHSWQYFHSPAAASTYVFPAVANTAVAHRIKLTIDFTAVQTYSFEDIEGNALTPLFTPSISAGDVYEFRCEYSTVQSRWLIYPVKEGGVSDDYVMQSEVGAANGVASLDSSGKVPANELPASTVYGTNRVNRNIAIYKANNDNIDTRSSNLTPNAYRPIVPYNLNYAVTAALTDANKISLTDAQKASAQDTLGAAPEGLHGSGAPTTSTVGKLLQQYLDDDTQKTYTCTAVTNTGTEAEPVWEYAWTEVLDENGGEVATTFALTHPFLTTGNKFFETFVVAGHGLYLTAGGAIGGNTRQTVHSLVLTAFDNVDIRCRLDKLKYNGHTQNTAGGICVLQADGTAKTPNGFAEDITVIPAATTAYTLAEGVQSHVPSSASTYTLPAIPQRIIADGRYFTRNPSTDGTGYYGWLSGTTNRYTASETPAVGDNTYTNTALTSGAKAITAIDNRTHECILTVRFSSSVLTYAFEDSAGNALTPLPLAGTIADGSVVCFRCTWEALLRQWVIMPVMLGTYEEVTP